MSPGSGRGAAARSPLDPGLLPTFLAVVDAGRISAAARTLHASQPAVTARIRRLEESLGAQLFRRSVRGVVPTAEGERLIRYAREVQATLERAALEIGAGEDEGEPLQLGASTTVAAHVLPPVLTGFRAIHPRAPLRLEVGNTDRVLSEVVAGRLPLAIVEGTRARPGCGLEPFVTDEIVPVASPKMRARVRAASDLRDLPLLWREPGRGRAPWWSARSARPASAARCSRSTWSSARTRRSSGAPPRGWASPLPRAGRWRRTS